MFHKTIELTSSRMLFGYKSISFDCKFGAVPMKKYMLNFILVLMNVWNVVLLYDFSLT